MPFGIVGLNSLTYSIQSGMESQRGLLGPYSSPTKEGLQNKLGVQFSGHFGG